MRILLLTDGKAGHASQSRAVTMALGHTFPVEVETVRCKLRAGLLQKPLRMLLNLTGGKLPSGVFGWFHQAETLPETKPDLVVSSGGNTVYANAWLGKQYGCANLFCGEVRGLRADLFAGIISPYEKHRGLSPYLISPTPVPIDRRELGCKAAAFRERSGLRGQRCWSLLVGGAGAGYQYGTADWERLAGALKTLAERHGIRWLVTTSRRSGPEAEAALQRFLPAELVAASSYALKGGGNISYHEILGVAERHFCTEDSHMMISEAIATGCPVHSLQPAVFQPDETNLHFLELYAGKGWLTRLPIAGLGETHFAAAGGTGEAPSVLQDLGVELARWWKRR